MGISSSWGSDIQEGYYDLETPTEMLPSEEQAPKTKVNRLLREPSKISASIRKRISDLKIPVGLPTTIKKEARVKKQKSYKAFAEMAKFPPPHNLTFSIKTDLQTFNHVNDYVIHNEIIWYRRRHQTEQAWTPMYFDGYPDKKPLKIQADGANLIVIDTANYIHYKKILKETLRIFEIEAQEHGAPDKKHPMLAQNDATDFTIKDGTIWVRFKDKKFKVATLLFSGMAK